MKMTTKLASTLLAVSVLGGGIYVAQAADSSAINDAAGVKTAAVSMTDAVNVALGAVPGTPSKAEYELDDKTGTPVWDVEIVSAQGVMDIEVDANTGKIIKQKMDEADQDEDKEDGDDEHDEKD